MITALITIALFGTKPLGYVALTEGSVTYFQKGRNAKTGVVIQRGILKRRLFLEPGDRLMIPKGGAVQGVYDGKMLIILTSGNWTAPKKGEFKGPNAPKALMARTQMGGDESGSGQYLNSIRKTLPIAWPAFGSAASALYVDGQGEFVFSWICEPDSPVVQLSVEVDGEPVGAINVPPPKDDREFRRFGTVSSSDLGLKIRSRSREDEVTPMTVTLKTARGIQRTSSWQLVSRRKARQWDGQISALKSCLSSNSPDWFEAWGRVLEAVSDASTMLRGYWTMVLLEKYPDAFVTRQAMRQLLEESGLAIWAKEFETNPAH